jgi:YD repeat-containing protein
MKKNIIRLAIILTFFSLVKPAFSTVWIRNGNFSLEFVDVNLGDGFELARYYNSLGFTKSMFGYGWGTIHGMRLGSVAGLMVMVEEIPGGGRSHYLANKDLGKLADRIITLAKVSQKNPAYVAKLKTRLLEDPMLLYEFAMRYKLERAPQDGIELECLERAGEKIRKTKNGYIRSRSDGATDEFDNDGRIIRQKFSSGKFLLYSYTSRGVLQGLRDQTGRWMKFFVNEQKGLLERVTVSGNMAATYKYDDRDNLIESTDINGNTYKYAYNSYHKMTEYVEPPLRPGGEARKWEMKYEKDTGRIVYQKTPDGWETYTEYSKDQSKGENYEAVSVIKRKANQVQSEKYEFWKRPKQDGTMYTYKTRQDVSGKVKTVTYTMCCGTPLVVNDDGKVTRFEYDTKSRLKKKVFSDGRIVEVRYDAKDRITSIINNGRPSAFKYNEKGQLAFAATDTVRFKLDYNASGNVARVSDNKGNSFEMKYDGMGRISSIVSKYGLLSIDYDERGRVAVSSKAGAKENMAKIRRVYQDYLDLMNVFNLISTI